MRSVLAFGCAVLVGAALVFAWRTRVPGSGLQEVPQPSMSQLGRVLGVEEFMRRPGRQGGRVCVEGIVSAVSADDHTLALIDRREFEQCGVTTCAALYLPVRWPGPMPGTGELVRIEGQARDEGGRLVFVARAVERVSGP